MSPPPSGWIGLNCYSQNTRRHFPEFLKPAELWGRIVDPPKIFYVPKCLLTLSIPGGGHYGPPYVIFFDNFLTEVFFDPNSSLVFLKTPKARFKTHFESKKIFTGHVIWVFSLRK